MSCSDEKLSALLDGDLGTGEAERVRAHVDGCADCRRALAELSSLRGLLGAAPAPEAPDDWAAVAQRLAATPERRGWLRWRFIPVAAVAALAVALVVVRSQRARGPSDDVVIAEAEAEFRAADAQYLQAIEKLRGVTARAAERIPVERRRELLRASQALEEATEQCRSAARARPADADAEALLFQAYRRQISFLQDQLLAAEALR
jgi:anti-sigma factor RsiW